MVKDSVKKVDFNNLKYCLKVLDVKLEKEISVDDYTFFNKFSTLVNKRKFLIENFCSRIIGFNEVKLGLILGMVANKKVKERSNSHILLIGPSFTGKTTFLKYVCRIMSPSRFVNGVGTSEVGLTACAVKEDGEWSLDTGALIATDGGACCIDGINYLDIKEKNGLLEAMEQQTISVAKAGINAKFKTCCTIIGSATINESFENYFDELGMSKPLLSRFDLIFYLKDNKSRINSMRIADEILNGKQKENLEELKNYLKSVKENLIEENDEAKEILIVYCKVKIEKTKGKEDFNTCRMLEGLFRLAKAHCKISCRNLLSEEDAFVSILLYESSVKGTKIVDFDTQHVFTNEMYFKEVVQSYKMIFFN
ncbi:DNA helicase mcm9 [Gurleya vavrai]